MSPVVQEKTKVRVSQEERSIRRFTLPEVVLPDGCLRMTIFCGDSTDELFSEDECPTLHKLCQTLMPPDERCTQIDHVLFIQPTQSRTEVEVYLASDFTTSTAQGRISAALYACGYEPVLGA
jgi:hypothetical protein